MDKIADHSRGQLKRHQSQDWARNLDEEEDVDIDTTENEAENAEFTDATVLKRKLLFRPKDDTPPKAVKVSNQFETLSGKDQSMDTSDIPTNTTETQKSKQKIPPIVISGTNNYSNIVKSMKTTMIGTFKVFYVQDGLKIHTTTLEDFKTLQALLKNTGQEYHTYTMQKDKPLKIVLKGLPPNMPTEDIKEELEILGYTVTDVRQFTSRTQNENSVQDIKRQLTITSAVMTIEKDQLRILVWNANSILQQAREFEDLLKTYGIDVALICETHLQETKRLHILGYTIYRTDRKHTRGGGTAVLIKNYLPHYRADIQDTENLEATAVGVNTKKGPITFVAVYNPPNKTLLKRDLDQVTVTDDYLIGGDLNSKNVLWNCRTTNRNGRILEEHSNETEYNVVAPDSPTFYPGNHLHRPDILDIILTNQKISSEAVSVLQELDSDHNPLLCEWDINIDHHTNWHKPTTKTTDWTMYKSELQEVIPINLQIETEEDVDAAIEIFTTTIQEAYETHTMTSQKRQDLRIDNPELNYRLALKREARRDWQRMRTPQARTNYNRLKAIVRRLVNQIRRTNWTTFVTETATNLQQTWKITNILKGKAKKAGTPAIHGRQGMAYTSKDKAEAIAETLIDQFTPNPTQEEAFNRGVVRTTLETWLSKWRVKVNTEKSTAMVVTKKRLLPPENFTLYQEEIPFKNQTKYLGINIDRRLTWANHIELTNKKAKAVFIQLYPILKGQQISQQTKLIIYRTVIQPIMLYGCVGWGYAAKTHIAKLQTTQNMILRVITGVDRRTRTDNLHNMTNSKTLTEIFKERREKFYIQSAAHMNPIIRSLGNYDPYEGGSYKRPRLE
uniref:Endonuclease/exonuclease/phosphatase domain-containing protein n=1 Tax=Timema monikensis TaxID=170555 RepID=A0A7R9E3K9_9NEOP|nr:unnamed protein product [Timema monikensis]